MTKNSESYLNQLVDVKAFHLIGYLLEKVNEVLTFVFYATNSFKLKTHRLDF